MDEVPQWLDDDAQAVWRVYLEATNLLSRAIDRDLRQTCDLTTDDYGVLVALSESPDHRLRLGELAAGLRLPKAHLTYRIGRLERAGLVERVECAADGRGVFAALTPIGFETLQSTAPDHVASVRRHLFDHLDRDQMHALAGAMTAVLAGHDRMDCPIEE